MRDDRWRTRAEQALEQGDLITAGLLLEQHAADQALEPDTLILASHVLRLRGRYTEAQALLAKAMAEAPTHVAVLVEQARLACELGALPEAHGWFERAWVYTLEFAPWVPEWLEVLIQLKQVETAFEIAQAHAQRAGDDAAAWFWLGYVLHLNKQLGAAFNAYHRCADLAPQWPMLRNNLAALYLDMHNYPAAKTQLDLALQADPSNPLAWTNLSVSWLKRGEPAAARIAVERALALSPQYALAWQTYSHVLEALREWGGARAAIERACVIQPDHDGYRWSLARLQLLRGEYRDGWRNFEARHQGEPGSYFMPREALVPRWLGESAPGKTILVWSDLDEGETLQFLRFVPTLARRVRAMGGDMVLALSDALVPLVKHSLGDELGALVAWQPHALPPHDAQLPLGSVPLLLDVSLDELSHYRPLQVIPDLTRAPRWQACGQTHARRFKVGLAWRSGAPSVRSPSPPVVPTALAMALAGLESVEFYSLQEQVLPAEQAAFEEAGLVLVNPMCEGLIIDETAALISQLDLVVTVSAPVAHLAGALNVPTWVLLDAHPDWVWMAEREDSPWYPSMRLYRQRAFGRWQPVLDALARDLQKLVQRAAGEAAADRAHMDTLSDG